MSLRPVLPCIRTVFLPALALALAGCASATGGTRAATGSIEGVIRHPAHVVPVMRVCAITAYPPHTPHCIDTRAGDDTYRIEGLPPGEYHVFAAGPSRPYGVGAYVQQVQCIRAPCPEQPKTITLTPDAVLGEIDLTFFDEARADFPALPPN